MNGDEKMTIIKCACGNPHCRIKISVEDDQHVMITDKDGDDSLMYFCSETRRALSNALDTDRAESVEARAAQLEADNAELVRKLEQAKERIVELEGYIDKHNNTVLSRFENTAPVDWREVSQLGEWEAETPLGQQLDGGGDEAQS